MVPMVITRGSKVPRDCTTASAATSAGDGGPSSVWTAVVNAAMTTGDNTLWCASTGSTLNPRKLNRSPPVPVTRTA